jgi:hypothetical protein
MSDSRRPLPRLLEQPNSLLVHALLRAGSETRTSEATRLGVLEALGLQHGPTKVGWMRALPFRRIALPIAALVISAAAVAVPLARTAIFDPLSAVPVAQIDPADSGTRAVEHGTAGPATETASVHTDLEKVNLPTDKSGPARASSHPTQRNALAAELATLDAVRNKLGAGEPRVALLLLDAYAREFPRPRLSLEAEVLRIDALDRAGQTEAAKKRAVAFVQNHPNGVLTGRVRRYLEK